MISIENVLGVNIYIYICHMPYILLLFINHVCVIIVVVYTGSTIHGIVSQIRLVSTYH